MRLLSLMTNDIIEIFLWAKGISPCNPCAGLCSQDEFHSCEPCPSSYHHQAEDGPVYIQLHDRIQPYHCKLWALTDEWSEPLKKASSQDEDNTPVEY